MELHGGMAITPNPPATAVEDQKTFEWPGKLGFSGVSDGRHRFEVGASPTGARSTAMLAARLPTGPTGLAKVAPTPISFGVIMPVLEPAGHGSA